MVLCSILEEIKELKLIMEYDLPYLLLPELKYDRMGLLELANDPRAPWVGYDENTAKKYPDRVLTEVDKSKETIFINRHDEVIYQDRRVKEIYENVDSAIDAPSVKFYKFTEGSRLLMHLDYGRPATLLVPVTLDGRSIELVDHRGKIHTVVYDVPLLIDGQVWHGLNFPGKERINLQFSYYDDFSMMCEKYHDGTLIGRKCHPRY